MTQIRLAHPMMPSKARLETLVDGIFAVAMTLLVLDIRLPEGLHLESNSDLLSHFSSVGQSFTVYVFSFVVLAMFWIAHNYQFHLLDRVDRLLLWINLGFLLMTTMVPFTTNLVASHAHLSLAVSVYALNIALLGIALLMHVSWLMRHPSLGSSGLTPALGRRIQHRLALLCVVPLLAAAIAPYAPVWAVRSLLLLVVMHFLPHRAEADPPPRRESP
jgi:uncharacterized membrane protein